MTSESSAPNEEQVDLELGQDIDPAETAEWVEALNEVVAEKGRQRAGFLLSLLRDRARSAGVTLSESLNTPYVNTIPAHQQPVYPGNREIERRIKSIIRWNAMAMVVRANRESPGIGGHISTFASAATLYEVGFNHFFRGRGKDGFSGDQIYIQGHATPGIYARAFLEGRLSERQLENFRRELAKGGGLSSYPHPWLMPSLWEFPTVSMGLGPIMAIYQARFNRYLQNRGIRDTSQGHVWAFLGDGECDEPETLGAITLAARERLDNLIFVINCNLQRLDGPVRGNGKIIQELEAIFRGAGWNVIKVIWGEEWDPLLEKDSSGLLVKRMGEVVDGQYQKYSVASGAYIREHFFGAHPELQALVERLSDEKLAKLRRGGHDPEKVYAAYKAAVEHKGQPTVILAKTIKGYGMGEAGEGRNVTHQQKKMNEEEMREFRSRFGIPISDDQIARAPFYRPPADGRETQYLRERRNALGGFVPDRAATTPSLRTPKMDVFEEFLEGSGDREVSTTMAFVRMLAKLVRDKDIGKYVVPIIPDEARTFGMESMFRQCGIYSSVGQLYEPVDSETLLYYKEAKDGQILEEGINEAGAMSSFIAAGTAHVSHGINMIPFFTYYSMFGFQRIGDLIWAAADMRCKGFLMGGTAGRTTLAGEGLQHQDGNSHLLAAAVPNLRCYDPAYAYEIAVIIQDGLRRMYQDREECFYYVTIENENYSMPAMPEGDGIRDGIIHGMYRFRTRKAEPRRGGVQLLGSGAILNETVRAQDILAERYGVSSSVWSVTSYKQLRTEAAAARRWNMLHPLQKPRKSYIEQTLEGAEGPFIAASDYVKLVAEQIAPWVPGGLFALGTDGFGRSEDRRSLRRFFEVDAECIVIAALYQLAQRGDLEMAAVAEAVRELGVDPDKLNPIVA
ncbi:MAG: pyruvate dehydrogenase (acetyl-transferring), homodimeric type [Phycisphaerae bacterium]|nr:pyruvate dehydrogenase (acetyl-transferring), homodimeric type [Phycisphaerae bacterium]